MPGLLYGSVLTPLRERSKRLTAIASGSCESGLTKHETIGHAKNAGASAMPLMKHAASCSTCKRRINASARKMSVSLRNNASAKKTSA